MNRCTLKYLITGIVMVVLSVLVMYVRPVIESGYVSEERPVEALNPLLFMFGSLCSWVFLPLGIALIAAAFVIHEVISYLSKRE